MRSRHLLPVAALLALAPLARCADAGLAALQAGDSLNGFVCRSVYLDARGAACGGRFAHRTGFTLDLLAMPTAPQGFFWARTPVFDDSGLPHTLEHLLLGKGAAGLTVAAAEELSHSSSSAFTAQLETCYHFSCSAGGDVFWPLLELRLDALLHPSYSDEEIRREVCHVGAKRGADGVELEEKGTVYTEMLSSWDDAWSRAERRLGERLRGPGHPLAVNQGGIPAAIRRMRPAEIRTFHGERYYLANMGLVLVPPSGEALPRTLRRMERTLSEVESAPAAGARVFDPAALPPSRRSPPAVEVLAVPGLDAGEAGLAFFVWLPPRPVGGVDGLLDRLLLEGLGGGTGELRRRWLDGATRRLDVDAAWLGAWLDDGPQPLARIVVGGLDPSWITEDGLSELRDDAQAAIAEVAAFAEGDERLAEWKTRAESTLLAMQRRSRGLLDAPPGFGERGCGDFWRKHLQRLNDEGDGGRLRVDETALFDAALERLRAPGNPFAGAVDRLGLLGGAQVLGTRCDPALNAAKEAGRAARLEAFADSLRRLWNLPRAAALERFAADDERVAAELAAAAAAVPLPELHVDPPLGVDTELVMVEGVLPRETPVLAALFESMAGLRVDLAFDLSRTPANDRRWLDLWPRWLDDAGLADGEGGRLDHAELSEALQREVAGAWAANEVDWELPRAELVLSGQGADPAEALLALRWLGRFVRRADWSTENLPRLRDLARRRLASLRQGRQGAEEGWVDAPAGAWLRQDRPELLHAGCFLTQEHDAFALAWDLQDAGEATAATAAAIRAVGAWAEKAGPSAARAGLAAWLELPDTASPADWAAAAAALGLPSGGTLGVDIETLRLAAYDLQAESAELPPSSFAGDWSFLAERMARGLETAPSAVLAEIAAAWQRLLSTAPLRVWVTGSSEGWRLLEPELAAWIDALPARRPSLDPRLLPVFRQPIVDRLTGRGVATSRAVGLLHPAGAGGVMQAWTPLTRRSERDPEALLDHLAASLYAGGSAHGVFMRTWAAGLAYSNGLRAREASGRFTYYAERCPDVAQTLGFVEQVVGAEGETDAGRVRTALAGCFGGSLAARDFAERSSSAARRMQLEGGEEELAGFRRALLELAEDPALPQRLEARRRAVHARLFPGLALPGEAVSPQARWFLIGPEAQFAAFEDYLDERRAGVELVRLHPRDFWLPFED